MQTINIPNTDLHVTPLCLGTAGLGATISPDDSRALLDAYIQAGGNFIDTAHVYSDWIPGERSRSEKLIGAWLKQSGVRDQIVLATKGAHPDLKAMQESRLGPDDLATDINESLDYLGVETIDLYWLHRDNPAVPVGEILEALHEHIQVGRLRYLGCSNWTIERIQAANQYAADHNISGFVANQPLWSLAEPNHIGDPTMVALDDAGIAFHKTANMAVIPYTAQAKGYFTKLDENRLKDSDIEQYDSETNRARFARVHELADKHGVSITAVVLSYLTSQPFPVAPIIGPKNVAQLQDSLQHADFRLSQAEVAYLVG